MAHMAGEVRGQVLAPITFATELSGDQEVPPVTTTATGASRLILAPTSSRCASWSPPPCSRRDHRGPHPGRTADENGPVAFVLSESSFGNPRLVTLTPADFVASPVAPTYGDFLDALRAGMTYVNVRTVTNGDGEIRGQIRAPLTLTAMLDGDQEVPVVTTTASGRGRVVINSDRNRMRFALTIDDLPADRSPKPTSTSLRSARTATSHSSSPTAASPAR